MNEIIIKQLQPYILGLSFLSIYIAEHLFPQRRSRFFSKHDALNTGVGLVNGVIIFIAGYFFQQLMRWLNNHHFGLLYFFSLNNVVKMILQLLLIDLFMYWWHRFNHQFPFLWRFHQFHHADTDMNSTTALRFHLVELSLSYIVRLLIFPLLGITVNAILVYSILFFPVVILHHSNFRISVQLDRLFRILFVTPHMHRIHHSKIATETNSNYSSLLPYWDMLFKTYKKKASTEIAFGL